MCSRRDHPTLDRKFLAGILLAALMSVGGHAHADSWGCDGGYDRSEITRTLNSGKSTQWFDEPCKDEECRATRNLECAAKAQGGIDLPNTMNYLNKRYFEADQSKFRYRIRVLGQAGPRRIRLFCQLLARVAPTVRVPSDDDIGDTTARYLTWFAILLDRPDNHCLADVVAAIPDTPGAKEEMQFWAIPCLKQIKKCQAEVNLTYR